MMKLVKLAAALTCTRQPGVVLPARIQFHGSFKDLSPVLLLPGSNDDNNN